MHLLPPLLLLPTTLAAISTVIITQTATTTATSPTSTSYTSTPAFEAAMLSAHNFYRGEHNASSLTWNTTSASTAATWASGCAFRHSGGPTGENLAAGYANASAAVDAWGMERLQYNFKKAEFSEATGHFTQVVWKASRSVGCGRVACDGSGGTSGWYVVCEYWPAGNVVGEFAENVQKEVSGKADVDSEGRVSGAGRNGEFGAETVVVLGCVVLGVLGFI